MDELNYSDEYVEALQEEVKALRVSHNQIAKELSGVYGSRTYRIGSVAQVAYRDPKRIVRKAAKIAKTTGRLSPQALRYFKSSTPHNSAIVASGYKQWQIDFEPSQETLNKQKEHAKKLKKKPVFSIITPVFAPPKDVLVELIESVLNQTYPHFELCLGEFSGDEQTRQILTEYAAKDKRIKIKFFADNDGISVNSNQCLTLATGDYVALLDHDDTLSLDALYENALMINERDYDFIYSDKDKIDEQGNRFDPMFKPDWSPELMLTANYLTHLNVFKRSILEKIGGWDKSTDGAQDWDLFLRLIAESKHVGHIPKILYHWRVIATSTALSITTKPYALEGQRRAIAKYIESMGIAQPKIRHSELGALSLTWGDAGTGKKVSCIITATGETAAQVSKLSKRILKTKSVSKDNIFVYIEGGSVTLKEVIEKAKTASEVVVFLDAQVVSLGRKTVFSELVGWLSVPGVGIASPQVYSKYGVFLDGGRVVGLGSAAAPLFAGDTYIPGVFGYREWSRNVSMPAMHCFAINTAAISTSAVSEEGLQGVRQLVINARLDGYRTVVTPFDAIAIDASAIYEPSMSDANIALLKSLIPDMHDPYFSTNLSVNKKYPIFAQIDEVSNRKEVVEQYLGQPIEHDVSVSDDSDALKFREELPLAGYKRDAFILSGLMDYTKDDLVKSRKVTDSTSPIKNIDSALWILPNFTTLYAGLKNIFALANQMHADQGTKHTFYITTQDSTQLIEQVVFNAFPDLEKNARFVNAPEYSKIKDTEKYTIGVCSLWTTAYELLKNNNMQRKLYIIQDDERSFYPAGSLQALVSATYDFGFWGIAGTQALAEWYENSQGSKGTTSVVSSELDLANYLNRSSAKAGQPSKSRILFYARPDAPRNGFELGIHGLNKLANEYNGELDIVLAGANFDLSKYDNISPAIRTAGKVAYKDLPEFYASFDASLFLMFSEHPGVFPLEMMASGCPVVINRHNNASWDAMYINNKTCVIADVTASSIADSLAQLLKDDTLKKKIVANGKKMAKEYNDHSHATQVQALVETILRK